MNWTTILMYMYCMIQKPPIQRKEVTLLQCSRIKYNLLQSMPQATLSITPNPLIFLLRATMSMSHQIPSLCSFSMAHLLRLDKLADCPESIKILQNRGVHFDGFGFTAYPESSKMDHCAVTQRHDTLLTWTKLRYMYQSLRQVISWICQNPAKVGSGFGFLLCYVTSSLKSDISGTNWELSLTNGDKTLEVSFSWSSWSLVCM